MPSELGKLATTNIGNLTVKQSDSQEHDLSKLAQMS